MSRSFPRPSRLRVTEASKSSSDSDPSATAPPPVFRYEEYVTHVDAALIAVARRYRLTESETEDLRSETWVKLLRTGGLAFRCFHGKSRLHTYLTAVVRNVLLDQRNKLWGKWRPSCAARRLGPTGIAIDRLLNRDRVPLDVIEHCVTRGAPDISSLPVRQIAAALPVRHPRRFVGESDLAAMPSPDPSPFEAVCLRERRRRQWQVNRALRRALASLSSNDRSLIASKYVRGDNVAHQARATGENQKRLYRRLSRILRTLRTRLEREGINRCDARHLVDGVILPADIQPTGVRQPGSGPDAPGTPHLFPCSPAPLRSR